MIGTRLKTGCRDMGEELNSRKKDAIEVLLVNVTRLENIKKCQDKTIILKIKEYLVTLMAQENKKYIYLYNATLKQNLVVRGTESQMNSINCVCISTRAGTHVGECVWVFYICVCVCLGKVKCREVSENIYIY